MKIGYARVSTKEQNLGRQLKALKDAGCQYIFEEKQSGKNLDRIEFKRMMANLKAGDTVVIADLTRIARSTADLFKIADDLKAKGITPIYLVTDYTGFYEKYEWEFLCMVQCKNEPNLSRMYIHR